MVGKRYILPLFAVCAAVLGVAPGVALGALGSLQGGSNRHPGWRVTARAYPTSLPPGSRGFVELRVYDVGAELRNGPVTVTDVLPAGVKYTGVAPTVFGERPPFNKGETPEPWACVGSTVVTCTSIGPAKVGAERTEEAINLEETIDLEVEVPEVTGSFENVVTASGGGALGVARANDQIVLGGEPLGFGLNGYEVWASNPDGTADTQAGSHPYELTVSFDLNTVHDEGSPVQNEDVVPVGSEFRNVAVNLPPGIVGDPQAVPQCPRQLFDGENCPASTQVGRDIAFLGNSGHLGFPVYNLKPPPGMPAQFGFVLVGIKTFLDAGVRSGGDYGITEHVEHVAQRDIVSNQTTIWGVPSDPSHDPERCGIVEKSGESGLVCGLSSTGGGEAPFLTLPTSCGEPPQFSIELDSWLVPRLTSSAQYTYADNDGDKTGFTGCNHLTISPTVSIAPDTAAADTPAGLGVDIKVPQEGLLEKEGVATANLENTTVTLPEGLVINPGQAAGLQACGESEAHLHVEGEGGAPACPNPSKVGTDEIVTPLLATPLKGDVYVLQSNPPELRLLVTASGEGVNLKLVGIVQLNEATGQLTTTFTETPELPFTDFKLNFSGGAQAALDTPTGCGTYSSNADFSPWSSPFSPDSLLQSSFLIDSGPGGSPCAGGGGGGAGSSLPFSPSLTAGSTTDQAGGFTNFSLLLQRGDGQQRIDGLQFKAPAGLTGELAKVPLCTNAQAEANACPEASKIGHTVVESGPGPYPLVVPEPGQAPAPIYLTESYGGAPFGLSIVVPLHVGPFTLPTQRVRAKIEINPITTQLTVTTNELPQIVAGVPTDLREVDAVIERPEFMVNPTNCTPQEFTGTAYGTPPAGAGGPSAQAAVSSHFGVGSCQSLKFEPELTASTSGRTSKVDGASLTYKIAYPNVPQGTDADIQYVKVELPGELPSRLTTLQKACTAKVFQANPAGCPKESVIGHAVVHTQLLPVPLEGPVYFVSNGGEAFPNLEMVLQGDGVTIELVGDTLIKNGVTSTTFKAVPDDPFSTFEITLGQGKYSALAANGNLCKPTKTETVKKQVKVEVKGKTKTVTRKVKEQVSTSLTIPSDYRAQNGATYSTKVPIAVTGCPKVKAAKKAKAKAKKKGAKKK
jgi:hypothetical protein